MVVSKTEFKTIKMWHMINMSGTEAVEDAEGQVII